jgi:hypothetical protein
MGLSLNHSSFWYSPFTDYPFKIYSSGVIVNETKKYLWSDNLNEVDEEGV